jgi:threonylcarbamoyladenosine tRNA methylthiotransferase MtaB
VLLEADRARRAGFKEIALTGVHLGSYGRDLSPRTSLAALLTGLSDWAERHGDVLFRVSSLEPMDCVPEVVDLVAGGGCFAPHFHLPLQHASDRVLSAMRRPYTIERFAALVDGIRCRIPDVSIGSDVIVGFPGETDDDFAALLSYLERLPLTHVHVFPYSDRPGTEASSMAAKVHGSVVRERSARTRALGRMLTDRFHRAQVGKVHRALTLEDGSLAVTGNYLKVRIPPGHERNEWVSVRITGSGTTAEWVSGSLSNFCRSGVAGSRQELQRDPDT